MAGPGMSATPTALPNDGNNRPIQVAHAGQTEDASGTILVSPITISDGNAITLTPPTNAIGVWIQTLDADLRVGWNSDLDGSGTGDGYWLLLNGKEKFFPCVEATDDKIYVKRDTSANPTFDFIWELMGDTLG